MLQVSHGTFCLLDAGDAIMRGFTKNAGIFDIYECILRLNIVGIGRFAISLYGEGKRFSEGRDIDRKVSEEENRIAILKDYLAGLDILAKRYDDQMLADFIYDFQRSAAYKKAFEKSVRLAELRNVPTEKILKNKEDIDAYFGGKRK